MFTMLYALVGVPLMLMCLSSLGGFLAEALQCSYGRLCGGSSSGGGSAGKREDGGKTHAVNNSQSVENEVRIINVFINSICWNSCNPLFFLIHLNLKHKVIVYTLFVFPPNCK